MVCQQGADSNWLAIWKSGVNRKPRQLRREWCIKFNLAALNALHNFCRRQHFGHGARAVEGVRRCGQILFQVGKSIAFCPYHTLPVDDGDTQPRHF